jgi:integrase
MAIIALKSGFRIDVTVNGERVRERYLGTKDDAKEREIELKLELMRGAQGGASASAVTMRTLYNLAVKHWETKKSDCGIRRAKNLLDEFIGWDTDPETINWERIEEMEEFYRNKGNSNATVNRKKAALSTMLRQGRRRDMIKNNPYFAVKPEDNRRERTISYNEEIVLIKVGYGLYGDDYGRLLEFLFDTGMRLGEVLASNSGWLEGSHLTVPSRMSKNGRARTISLSHRIVRDLPEIGSFFPNYIGKDTRHLYNKLYKLKSEVGLPPDDEIVYHSIRHTYASRAIRNGVDPISLKNWLGHTNITMTDRYTHLNTESADMIRERMEKRD